MSAIATLVLLIGSILGVNSPEIPCPGDDSAGYVLTETHNDGSFRCEIPA